jgi:hypothetical protein
MSLGEDRGQAALLPAAIEDCVKADAPVRAVDTARRWSCELALSSELTFS